MKTTRDIAENMGVCVVTVRRHAKKLGIALMRKHGGTELSERDAVKIAKSIAKTN